MLKEFNIAESEASEHCCIQQAEGRILQSIWDN